jgi:hypothetical protein
MWAGSCLQLPSRQHTLLAMAIACEIVHIYASVRKHLETQYLRARANIYRPVSSEYQSLFKKLLHKYITKVRNHDVFT